MSLPANLITRCSRAELGTLQSQKLARAVRGMASPGLFESPPSHMQRETCAVNGKQPSNFCVHMARATAHCVACSFF